VWCSQSAGVLQHPCLIKYLEGAQIDSVPPAVVDVKKDVFYEGAKNTAKKKLRVLLYAEILVRRAALVASSSIGSAKHCLLHTDAGLELRADRMSLRPTDEPAAESNSRSLWVAAEHSHGREISITMPTIASAT
jgi:hypothetical protein